MKGLLDTNVVLSLLGGKLKEFLPQGWFFTSIICEMELLLYPHLSAEEENRIRDLLGPLDILNITPAIKNRAIELRKQYRFKLPDAIIASSALEVGATLFSNDRQLGKINGLKVITLEAR